MSEHRESGDDFASRCFELEGSSQNVKPVTSGDLA